MTDRMGALLIAYYFNFHHNNLNSVKIMGVDGMKRVLIIVVLLLLTACGGKEINGNISKVMADDTQQVLDTLNDTKANDIEELTETEMDVILSYVDKHIPNEHDMNDVERELLSGVRELIESVNDYLDNEELYEKKIDEVTGVLYRGEKDE